MKERPILFNRPMVRAILDGTKTQTRRVVKPEVHWVKDNPQGQVAMIGNKVSMVHALCPYGQPGDRLWVKETWNSSNQWNDIKPTDMPEGVPIFYAADYNPDLLNLFAPWRPSLFMRRWMSRLTLEITGVRVERVQDITETGARAEGCEERHSVAMVTVVREGGDVLQVAPDYVHGVPAVGDIWHDRRVTHVEQAPSKLLCTARDEFRNIWRSINGPESWAQNPWVWVVEFRRVQP
jgi:hypothetical protein